jgi:undecaprenyl-diphosphatase
MNASTNYLIAFPDRYVWVGQHALVLYFCLLALLLCTTWVGWWLLRQSTLMRLQRKPGATPTIGWQLVLGLVVMLAGVGSFLELAGQINAGSPLSLADQALTQALRTSLNPQALQAFAALTHFGDTTTLSLLCLGVALLLLAHKQHALAWGWALTIAGNGLLNQLLKPIFGRVRPLGPDGSELAQGWSFPSGHTSGAVVAYGMLAYLALRLLSPRWHLPALIVAVTLAFSIAVSRVMLQVHFASDVLAGLASGVAWLALCITLLELLHWWRSATY